MLILLYHNYNKIPEKYRDITSYIALLLAVILNIVNALIFKGDTLVAFREAFVSCGIALGCFNLGKSVKNIVDKNNN
jgi:hypothetical protein